MYVHTIRLISSLFIFKIRRVYVWMFWNARMGYQSSKITCLLVCDQCRFSSCWLLGFLYDAFNDDIKCTYVYQISCWFIWCILLSNDAYAWYVLPLRHEKQIINCLQAGGNPPALFKRGVA